MEDHHAHDYDFLCKILLVGPFHTGKSALRERFCDDSFNEKYIDDKLRYLNEYRTKKVQMCDKTIKFLLWVVQPNTRNNPFSGTHGILLVYDVTNIISFRRIKEHLHEVNRYGCENSYKILVGNCCDQERRRVDYNTAKAFAEENALKFIETSAKTGLNVEECFAEVAYEVFASRLEKLKACEQSQQ